MTVSQNVESLRLVGKTDAMQQLYKMIGRVCNADCAVLLIGEKGSGKKVVARALHYFSHRSASSFLVVSGDEAREASDEQVLGIDETHQQREGTCYITSLNAMPVFLQHRLLEIHRTRQFRCSHRNRYEQHSLRFVVGNDGDIGRLLESRVSLDLYFDWNFLPLFVPPLRDRKEDIPLLANHFLDSLADQMRISRKELSPEATEILVNYRWPGNLDELKQVLRTAIGECRGSYIRAEHLPELNRRNGESTQSLEKLEYFLSSKLSPYIDNFAGSYQEGDLFRLLIPQLEKPLFQYALKQCRGNRNKAADLLGLHRNTLNKKLQKIL